MKGKTAKNSRWPMAVAILIMLGILGVWRLSTPRLEMEQTEFSSGSGWWEFQAVDTMKYSRDLAGEMINKPSFDAVIERQVASIASTGATHVAIATPYDEEFLPFLKKWVSAARRHGLKVWFRGNFAGWEEWFGFNKITRSDHLRMTREFIDRNRDLFETGDYFTACPECENGGPGNPFTTGDTTGHRQFLIELFVVANQTFKEIGKNVQVNLNSMNGDVAKLIMDPGSTVKMGGVVTIDHYVKTPRQLDQDVRFYAKKSGTGVILGEYGAPIPDIHGGMSEQEQADWLEESLSLLARNPYLLGISYWTNTGGSTELWRENGEPKKGVAVLEKYFKPKIARVRVIDELDRPIAGVVGKTPYKKAISDRQGMMRIALLDQEEIFFEKKGYTTLGWNEADGETEVRMTPTGFLPLYTLRKWLGIK